MDTTDLKTLSLRKFRDSVAYQTEPIAVMQQDGEGGLKRLGVWVPANWVTRLTVETPDPRIPAPMTETVRTVESPNVSKPGLVGLAEEVDAGRGDTVFSDALKQSRSTPAIRPAPKPSAKKKR